MKASRFKAFYRDSLIQLHRSVFGSSVFYISDQAIVFQCLNNEYVAFFLSPTQKYLEEVGMRKKRIPLLLDNRFEGGFLWTFKKNGEVYLEKNSLRFGKKLPVPVRRTYVLFPERTRLSIQDALSTNWRGLALSHGRQLISEALLMGFLSHEMRHELQATQSRYRSSLAFERQKTLVIGLKTKALRRVYKEWNLRRYVRKNYGQAHSALPEPIGRLLFHAEVDSYTVQPRISDVWISGGVRKAKRKFQQASRIIRKP